MTSPDKSKKPKQKRGKLGFKIRLPKANAKGRSVPL